MYAEKGGENKNNFELVVGLHVLKIVFSEDDIKVVLNYDVAVGVLGILI